MVQQSLARNLWNRVLELAEDARSSLRETYRAPHSNLIVISARSTGRCIVSVLGPRLRFDWLLAGLVACYLAAFAPLIARNTDNPQQLAAYVNDEPFLTMALEATIRWPYGNPGNYFDSDRPRTFNTLPAHWGSLRYDSIFYYGGSSFQIAFPFYATARLLGLPAFPTGPIILRCISLFAALAAMIILYNVAKERGSRAVGALSFVYLMTDPDLLYYVLYIHPDTLQMLFGLCALLLGVAHVGDGRRLSLFAFGIFCGIVQGTKVGGPWLGPVALLTVWLGFQVSRGRLDAAGIRWLGSFDTAELLQRVAILVGAIMFGYFISTPYAFIDGYYLKALFNTLQMVNTDHLQQKEKITLMIWVRSVFEKIGWIGVAFIAAILIRVAWVNGRRVRDPFLLLATVVAASQLLWFGYTGRLWVILGYLILAIGLVSLLSFETALAGVRTALSSNSSLRQMSTRRWAAVAGAVALTLVFVQMLHNRWYVAARMVSDIHFTRQNTVRAATSWAIESKIPPDSFVLFDDLAYFDHQLFPKARMHGGVLTWAQVEYYDPDYIVLSSSLNATPWAKHLIETQKSHPLELSPYNMRLYQDLLSAKEIGEKPVPGVVYVKRISPILATLLNDIPARRPLSAEAQVIADQIAARLGSVFDYCSKTYLLCHSPLHDFLTPLQQGADIERRVRALFANFDDPLMGPELRFFKVNRPGSLEGRAAPFADGTRDGTHARHGFGIGGAFWLCAYAGEKARDACAIGYDFGMGGETAVRRVSLTWHNPSVTPRRFSIEHSDDKQTWTTISVYATDAATPVKGAAETRQQSVTLPDVGRHRYWRLRAAELAGSDAQFGVGGLIFSDTVE